MPFITHLHSIEELLKDGSEGVLFITSNKEKSSLINLAKRENVTIKAISKKELDQKAPGNRGYAFETSFSFQSNKQTLETYLISWKDSSPLILLLDGITDPQNLGSILRSADQFKADLVIIPSDRAVQNNETVLRVSAGAAKFVPVLTVINLTRTIKTLKEHDFWIYGATMEGSPVQETNLKGRVGFVLGSEGEGISRLVKENVDQLVAIETKGHIDSLNVSVSAGILLYEARRQQGF